MRQQPADCAIGFFLTELTAPGSSDEIGSSRASVPDNMPFAIPCSQPPPDDGSKALTAGSRTDVGSLALFLVSNWFVNGETVLIDGGVSGICVAF